MKDKCEYQSCRDPYYINFKGHKICQKHWKEHRDNKINLNSIFNIDIKIQERKQQKELSIYTQPYV